MKLNFTLKRYRNLKSVTEVHEKCNLKVVLAVEPLNDFELKKYPRKQSMTTMRQRKQRLLLRKFHVKSVYLRTYNIENG